MTDREKVIAAYICQNEKLPDKRCKKCPYGYEYLDQIGDNYFVDCNTERIMMDAIGLLKAQEPRLIVKEDFENADKYGYLPVFVENREGDMYWDCITDAALGDTFSRFWTAKPTNEQRKMVKWDD